MNDQFDKPAQSFTRRQALQRCGLAVGGALLGTTRLGTRLFPADPARGPSALITQNFTGSTINDCPNGAYCAAPDCDGAVGPRHFVELVNNHYAVYRKGDGVAVQAMAGDDFWRSLGITFLQNEHVVDPQILFDHAFGRWYATAQNFNDNKGGNSYQGSDLLFAVSKSSDPTEGWTGFKINLFPPEVAGTEGPHLGFNQDGVYIRMAKYTQPDNMRLGDVVVVLPKMDLLAATPSVGRRTVFDVAGTDLMGTWPGVVTDMDNAGAPGILLSGFGGSLSPSYTFGVYKRTDIVGPVTSPRLDFGTGYPDKFLFGASYRIAPPAPQPDANKLPLKVDFPIHQTPVVLENGELWSVTNAVDNGSGRGSIHWLRMDLATNTLIEEGFIGHPELTYFYPSIAVNGRGDVVIGFNGCGPNPGQYASSYAIVGKTRGNRTSFGEPLLLKAGVATYQDSLKVQAFGFGDAYIWGDYSWTTLDPEDPYTFWTIQQWASSKSTWSTQITALTVAH